VVNQFDSDVGTAPWKFKNGRICVHLCSLPGDAIVKG